MSDKVYDVPAEWAKRAWVNEAKYEEMYKRSLERPAGVLGRARQAHRLVHALHQGQEHLVRRAQRFDQVVRGRRHQRRSQLHRPPSAEAGEPDRDHLGRRRSVEVQAHHLRRARRPGRTFRQRAEGPRRQEGRPRHHLSADDSRDGLRDARLRAHRGHPFGRVRRLLGRSARRPHRGRQVGSRHHRGRRPARRAQGAAEGQCRCRRRKSGRRQDHDRRQAHRRRRRLAERARRLAARSLRGGDRPLPARADERRGSAVHPLHLRFDRRPQGRASTRPADISSSPR